MAARASSAAATAASRLQRTGQAGRRRAKVWVVTSASGRPSHVPLDGQTVPVGERFSNGALWPGDPVQPADEVAGCTCKVEFRP